MSPYYKIVGIIVLFICFSCSSAQDSECTNENLIGPIATNCLTNNAVPFGAASGDAAKCVVILENIVANCIVAIVQNTYSVTCNNAQEYQLVVLYRDTITTALSNFDPVVKCLPEITCANITAITYYADRLCSTELTALKASESCSDLCSLAECYASASQTSTAPKTECAAADFVSTVSANAAEWTTSTTVSQSSSTCCSSTSTTSTTNTQETTTHSDGSPSPIPQSLFLAFGIALTLVLSLFH